MFSPCTDNAPPSYDPVGPSSYGTVDYDAYQQPQPAYAQTTTFAGYPTHETGYQQQPVHETVYQQQPVYATTTTTAVTTQPGVPRYRPPKPSTHIWLSVFTMICCCFVLGLIAIIVGMEVCLPVCVFVCVCVCGGGGGGGGGSVYSVPLQ